MGYLKNALDSWTVKLFGQFTVTLKDDVLQRIDLQALAEHWRGNGDESLGVEILKILKDVLENRRPPRSRLAEAYLKHGKPARAAELFAWCLEKDGEDPALWRGLIDSLSGCGQADQAKAFRKAGHERWPNLREFSPA